MSKDEFRKYVEAFYSWTCQDDRSPSSWLCSLENWAGQHYALEYKKEQDKVRVVKPDEKQ